MKIIDERQIQEALKKGERILFLKESRLTPAALDLVRRSGMRIVEESGRYVPAPSIVHRLVIGCDHGGWEMKEGLKPRLVAAGYFVQDVGTFSTEAVDYPDFAGEVARWVGSGRADRGIMIDSIGVASAICANKIGGVRAAPCWNKEVAQSTRSHNDANVITIGGKIMTVEQAWAILEVFLKEPFSGGRHETRVRKMMAIEKDIS